MPGADLDAVVRDYRAAFLRSLPRHNEAALTLGYDLGRRAVADGISILDLVEVHHVVLAEVLEERRDTGPTAVTQAASAFLLEVLSTFDMAHRALRAVPEERTGP
ncbi:phosphatase RsbU N-terminal domain-containing protein [Oryzobacter terrae]|uniref:phosphatase RsbU N-terminal domain-containing protein n=1 Tax=Oryzobacter terrae TaxID=1620385 RepID=UPI00366EF6C6